MVFLAWSYLKYMMTSDDIDLLIRSMNNDPDLRPSPVTLNAAHDGSVERLHVCTRVYTRTHSGYFRTESTRHRGSILTESAGLLPRGESAPLVGDGLQHLLQRRVRFSARLLAQTGEGRHRRAGTMTPRNTLLPGTGTGSAGRRCCCC